MSLLRHARPSSRMVMIAGESSGILHRIITRRVAGGQPLSRKRPVPLLASSSFSYAGFSTQGDSSPPTNNNFDNSRPFQITTPIYYVNDKPHIGHAYTSTACDVMARFMRLSGREVYFLTGTDEHGQKVEQSAAQKGVPPQQFADQVSQDFRELLGLLNISNDYFLRTTDAAHKESVQHFWKVLVEKGYIYKGTYSGWYSVRDETFYKDSELIEGKAPTGATVEWVGKEESYFFQLSAFQEKLLEYYQANPNFIAPKSRRNEVIRFVEGGLRDLSISRASFQWGVPVPGDEEDHVMYVWIDALTNYISALGYPNMEAGSHFDKFWPASLHVVGKDILLFHAVYWPAFLMAADIAVPERVFAHGWWTKEGEKISKSLGNVIDPVELVEQYGADQTRFFLMTEVGFGSDGDFSEANMVLKVNNNLANELGNLCQRVLSMVYKNCDKAMPKQVAGPLLPEDIELLDYTKTLHDKAASAISKQAIQNYANELIATIWEANKYIDAAAPWTLRKSDPKRMETVLLVLLEVLRKVTILYQPIIPESASQILDQLQIPESERTFAYLEEDDDDDDDAFRRLPLGASISKPIPVFPKLEVAGE